MKRTALRRVSKTRKKRRLLDPDRGRWIHTEPCIVCGRLPVECAHVGDRGYGFKCDDTEILPICAAHHRTGKQAQHVRGRNFWTYHGIDRDELVAKYKALYAESRHERKT